MKHVLYDVKKTDVDLIPFPHVVVKPYKDDVIQQLIDETPRCNDFPGYKNKENHRLQKNTMQNLIRLFIFFFRVSSFSTIL